MIKNKKAQITIFVIVGILVIAVIGLLFVLFRGGGINIGTNIQENSNQILQQCINDNVEEITNRIIANAGTVSVSTLNKNFEDGIIPYLCYTGNYYSRCVPQAGLILSKIEQDILNAIEPRVNDCFTNLKTNLEDRAYIVELNDLQEVEVNILPGIIRTNVKRTLIQTKSDKVQRFENFEINLKSPLYDLNKVTHEIITQESTICNSDYLEIMAANKGIEITKFQTGDDDKIYTVTDLDTKIKWRFAVRSCVLAIPG